MQYSVQQNDNVESATLPKTGYASLNDMLPYLPIKRSTVWKWVKDGRFPVPVKIHTLTRWRCVDIHAWLNQYADTGACNGEV
ncbi:AlpA family transcriptional regulator [Acinetobacter baumannii]|uniref:helix-turn-helix transcriptional regulator n=1 Tax=Acinetobacter baumannii TaxID=470 RepID=UPI002223527A|nr:helix-turn-helix domain-containing protein [Acinetobacter baumannii]MCW1520472.1 helix-turn-helix domain-containing protein [Acinetobacter baumannii]